MPQAVSMLDHDSTTTTFQVFQNTITPYATQPLLCLRPPTVPGRPEAPMLKLSCTGVGWGLDLPADDPCRWLTEPAVNAATFLHHYGNSYLWRLRDVPVWTTDMVLDCLERLPAHSYALVELSHVLHSIPTNVFVRLLTALTRLCCPGGLVRWVEGSWLQTQQDRCVQAIARVRRFASERGCGCPDAEPATMGNVSVLPMLMQQWLSRMGGQPVEHLDIPFPVRASEQTPQTLARVLPFWLRTMSEEMLAPADALASACLQAWHRALVHEILQPSFIATCTMHVLWTRPVEEGIRC